MSHQPRRLHVAATESELEARLRDALAERDAALLELARARGDLEALRMAIARRGEEEPNPYPITAGIAPPALRYLLADALNDAFKPLLGPLHRRVRTAVEKAWTK